MSDERIKILRQKIKSHTEELNDYVCELLALIDGDIPETGATEDDMGIRDSLARLISNER